MYSILGENFRFVATEPIHEERISMGYVDMSEEYPFSLNTYKSDKDFKEAILLGKESDVVIIGSAPDLFIKDRLIENKCTFRYYERIFKKGRWRVLSPRTLYSLYKNHLRHKHKKIYMLCASAYTATDFKIVGAYSNKMFKWGYFPEVKKFDVENLFLKKKNTIPKILWVGRLIDLKHPEHAVLAAYNLKKLGYSFTLDIIGIGPMDKKLLDLINKYKLVDRVSLLGGKNPEEVRKYMELANIYLFTSDFNEGWGAVLNESMNSGCAVVASHAIGSVPFLINNGKNGLIYKNGDLNNMLVCLKSLLDDNEYCEKLGKNAYYTLSMTWNAKEAAERLLTLSESLIKDEPFIFESGPCSIAEGISHRYNPFFYDPSN